jgi:hypothetical protein
MTSLRALRLGGKLLILGCVAASGIAYAQGNASVVRRNTFEVGGFVGATYGGTGAGSANESRVMGGGNVTYAVTRMILPYFEYSYFPGIPRNPSGSFAGTGRFYQEDYSIPLQDFHGGVHIRLPIFREKPIVPYGVLGFGALKSGSGPDTITFDDGSGTRQKVTLTLPGQTVFTVNGGGGVRIYLSQRFGLRGEAKFYKPTGDVYSTFGKVEFGFFVQLN